MPVVEFFEQPRLNRSILITAFTGWPDAAEGATRAVREVVKQLKATRFAAIDPEEFYDFSRQRPAVSSLPDGNRKITWVKNEFFYWRAADHGIGSERDLVILLGAEPHTRWRTFSDAVMEVATLCNVEMLLVVGSLLAQSPHTRPARVIGTASSRSLGPGLESVDYAPPTYEGPSSMTSVLMEALGKRGVNQVSLWGQSPHYVQVAQNPAVSFALLREIQPFLPTKLNLTRMQQEADEFAAGLVRALEGQRDIASYVKRLEEEYDAETRRSSPQTEPADPAALVKELEEFLRQQRKQPPDGPEEEKS